MQSRRVLLVDAEDVLTDAGYCVVGPAHQLEPALELAREAPLDAAVFDVNLAGVAVWPVADLLYARGLPVVLLTGFGKDLKRPQSCEDAPLVGKPVCAAELLDVLDALMPDVRSPSPQACRSHLPAPHRRT